MSQVFVEGWNRLHRSGPDTAAERELFDVLYRDFRVLRGKVDVDYV